MTVAMDSRHDGAESKLSVETGLHLKMPRLFLKSVSAVLLRIGHSWRDVLFAEENCDSCDKPKDA